jgi:hypothetical protein
MELSPTLLANIVTTLGLIRIGLEEGHVIVDTPEGADQAKQNLIDTINALTEGVQREVLGVLHAMVDEANAKPRVPDAVDPDNVIVFPIEPIEA